MRAPAARPASCSRSSAAGRCSWTCTCWAAPETAEGGTGRRPRGGVVTRLGGFFSALLSQSFSGQELIGKRRQGGAVRVLVEEPVREHPAAEGRPRGGVLIAEGLAGGRQRRGQRLFDRGDL